MQLTFASYNIHKAVGLDRKRDPERILSVLREIDADVIALQEVDRRIGQRSSVLPRAALANTPWKPVPLAKRPRSLGWHGNALLVRRDMEILAGEPMELPTLEPRGAVRAEIGWQGRSFCALGMHLDLSGLRRRDQIQAILAERDKCCEDMPTVMLGDFNQWGLRSGAMDEFWQGWTVMAPGRSYPSRAPIARLDRIVASRDWMIGACGVHHSATAAQASDHLPVWAKLSIA